MALARAVCASYKRMKNVRARQLQAILLAAVAARADMAMTQALADRSALNIQPQFSVCKVV